MGQVGPGVGVGDDTLASAGRLLIVRLFVDNILSFRRIGRRRQ